MIEDRIEYGLPAGALGRVAAGGLAEAWLSRTFAYRHALLRLDLERHGAEGPGRPLHVAVTGASGLVGRHLCAFLSTGGHRVTRLVRRRPAGPDEIEWEPAAGRADLAALDGVDAVVHLGGANIGEGRFTEARKALIRDSRVDGTRVLALGLARLARPPGVVVSASAVGYYGNRGDTPLDEASAPGEGFLPEVCRAWEAAVGPIAARSRVVLARLGIVLSPAGGALARLLMPFRLGAGGRVGSGRQFMSWIGLEDAIGAIHFALGAGALAGPVNVVAPAPVTNAEFARTLARVLGRPALLPLPERAVRLAFGEMGEALLLASQRVRPRRLEEAGFRFRHRGLEDALRFALGRG